MGSVGPECIIGDLRKLSGKFFRVTETGDPNLAHVWDGVQVKKTKGGYVDAEKGYTRLIRKAGSRIVGVVK